MHCYAVSCPNSQIANPEWQKAVASAAIKRIEYSCAEGTHMSSFAEDVKILCAMQERGEVEVGSIHIPFGAMVAVGAADEYLRKSSVEYIKEFMKITAPIGCRNYTLHPSTEPIAEDARAAHMAGLRKSLLELEDTARAQGAVLNLENLPRTCLGRDLREMVEILEGLPEDVFGYCIDVNHFCGFAVECPEIIARLGKRINSMHINDYDGVDECHWYPGLGVLDWVAIIREIRKLPQEVTLIQETYGFLRQRASVDNNAVIFRNVAACAYFIEHAEEIAAAHAAFPAGGWFNKA